MIVLDLLKKVYHKYEGDTDYPDFTDDDMQLYFALLKDSLEDWVDEFPEFRELYAELADAVDGDKVTAPGVSTISAPTNFVRPATFITVGSKKLEYVPPQKMEQLKSQNSISEWYSITGYPGAYKLVLNPVPSAIETVNYPYYKTITAVSGSSSVIEISRPRYCLYYILNQLYLDDESNKDLAKMYEGKMKEQIVNEKIALAKTPGTPNRMKDSGVIRYGAGFGRLASSEE